MTSILPFDELNKFEATLRERFADGKLVKEDEEDIIDEMLDLFLLAYAKGNSVTNANLSSDWMPTVDDVMKVVDERVAGKTWRERAEEYFTKASNGEIPVSKPIGTTSTATTQPPRASGESSEQRGQTGAEEPATPSGGISLQESITRIAETEMHRIANTAALDTAKKAGAKTKTWHCMMLPTSRDTHIYLNGVTAPIDGEFYSFKGGKTQFPGQWGIAEEDINCLCWLTFS